MSVGIIDEDMIATRLNWPRSDMSDVQESPKAVGPREIYGLLRRRKVMIAAIVAAGTLLSLLASYNIPKTYTARSMIVLEADDPNLLDDSQQPLTQQPNKAKMDTETDLIRSRVFVGRVVDATRLVENPNFNTYLPKPVSPAAEAPGEAGLLSSIRSGIGDFLAGDADETPHPLPALDVQRDRAVSALLSMLSVTRSGESMAMTVAVSYDDPAIAASLANAVTHLFVEWSRDMKRDNTKDAVAFLREQSRELAANIAETERQIAEYSRDNDVSSDPRDDLLRAAMTQANEQLSIARGDLAQAQARLSEVRQDAAGKAASGDPLLASDFLTTLRNEEATALRERAQLARNLGVNHPLLQEADAQIASVRTLIAGEMQGIIANLENDVRVAEGRVAKLQSSLADFGRELRQRSLAEIRLRELNRDLLTEQKLHDVVSGRLGKLDPYADSADPGARVISIAEVPTEPSFPKPRILVAGGFTGAFILAFVVAMTSESLDTRVRSGKRVSQILRAPVVASIPDLPRRMWRRSPNAFVYLCRSPRSAFAEGFRSIYNACRRANAGRREQVVMVSSGLPLEGKTTTAIGLAVAAASDGARTVLVDLDLRTGSLHAAMKLYQDIHSLDDYLRGDCVLHDIVQVVPGVPNLDVVTSSADGHHHTGVLNSNQLERLVSALRHEYDVVVIDAPPLLVVEDAASISASVDAVVLVTAWDRTTEEALAETGERLRLNNAPLIGIVLNRVDPRLQTDSAHRASRAHFKQFGRYFSA